MSITDAELVAAELRSNARATKRCVFAVDRNGDDFKVRYIAEWNGVELIQREERGSRHQLNLSFQTCVAACRAWPDWVEWKL